MDQTLFDELYATVDYAKGICPWDAVKASIEQSCLPWYDPRFIKGYHELLYGCFLNTVTWLKGQYYAELVLSHMPPGIDDELLQIAQSLNEGKLPESGAWVDGNPYMCSWPAVIGQYVYPWNGCMVRWAIAHKEQRRLLRRLKVKASGYRSPRRNIYRQYPR